MVDIANTHIRNLCHRFNLIFAFLCALQMLFTTWLGFFYRDINPDVEFEAYNYNITLLENFKHFLCRIR